MRPATLFGLAALAFAQAPGPMTPDPNMVRPIDAIDSVFIEELTWLEVRDALRAGKTTVLIATGGMEQNGPWLATGKHNYILRACTEAIARKLGNALVAPIIPFVPEGDIDPPSGHMKYPGSISLTEDTYRRLLTDIAASFKATGFRHVILLGDSGGNQAGMKEVAATLADRWKGSGTTIHYIPEFYDYPGVMKWLESQGLRQTNDGIHDDFAITSQMMVVDPNTVRMRQRMAIGKFTINGVNLAPAEKTIEWGKKVVAHRADVAVASIRKALAAQR
jgi:creatinine amidohydrolase/Fe(II)-dependent formamide hydrolase-like protein